MRQPPFWSFKKSRLIEVSDLFPAAGSRRAGQGPLAAALPPRLRPGRGALRRAPGTVRQGRGAERRLRSAGPIAAASAGFFGVTAVVAHQVVTGLGFIIAIVVAVVFVGYFVDSIALLERQVEFETPTFG